MVHTCKRVLVPGEMAVDDEDRILGTFCFILKEIRLMKHGFNE